MTLAQIIASAFERERRAGALSESPTLYGAIYEIARRTGGYEPELYPRTGAEFRLRVYTDSRVYRIRVKAPFCTPRVSVDGARTPEIIELERTYRALLSDSSDNTLNYGAQS